MKQIKFWQVDAFSDDAFHGNPAAVIYLNEALDEKTMQLIAMENNLAETAFVLLRENKNPLIRWFTPKYEIDLCGHATLASSHIYFTEINPNASKITFDTLLRGRLIVEKVDNGYTLDFPETEYNEVSLDDIPSHILAALTKAIPVEAYKGRDYLFVYENEEDIINMEPNFGAIAKEDKLIVTAKSKTYDFISRFFCPNIGINEDPVTGSAHCMLTPYWSKKLNKTDFNAYQASPRGGHIQIEYKDKRVLMTGGAVTLIKGEFIL